MEQFIIFKFLGVNILDIDAIVASIIVKEVTDIVIALAHLHCAVIIIFKSLLFGQQMQKQKCQIQDKDE